MTQSKVEEVAEAIWSAHTGATDFHQDTYRHDEKEREWWRGVARAAIAAMRNPTPDMKAAGAKSIPEPGNYDFAHDAYVNMINAALEE